MKHQVVDIFAELGCRLASFGEDVRTQKIIGKSVEQNPWFTPVDIVRAAHNIAGEMLSAAVLTKWLSRYSTFLVNKQGNILIIMAGNIPFVGFHDLLCVLASGHRALLKMSSKDTVLMSYIVAELLAIEPSLPVSEYIDGDAVGAVIAMGGDNAVRAIRARYSDIPTLLRGSRSSLAVLSGSETPEQLDGLADDVLSFSGLGCRNVSLIFMPERYDVNVLAAALRRKCANVNRRYLNNYRQVKALLSMNNVKFIDCGCCVLCDDVSFPSAISRINYAYYSSKDEVTEWIMTHESEIQCVAGNAPFDRAVGFGETQKPAIMDYPDGRDTMEFLAAI